MTYNLANSATDRSTRTGLYVWLFAVFARVDLRFPLCCVRLVCDGAALLILTLLCLRELGMSQRTDGSTTITDSLPLGYLELPNRSARHFI